MPKTKILFTGGTISMKEDAKTGIVPKLSPEDLMDMIQDIDARAEIELEEFGRFSGPQMTPTRMLELANCVRAYLNRDEIDSVIITHGTDTLEETAYFLDVILEPSKPVIVVGAMRNASELGFDGPPNLAAAIVASKAKESMSRGVLVCLNNEVHAAREVTKTHTMSLGTFRSPEFGPLGMVDNNRVLYAREASSYTHLPTDSIEEEVYLLKSYAGMGRTLIDSLVEQGAKGIVIEAMGRGNLPPDCAKALMDAIDAGVVVVLVSRCPEGRVLASYGYEGGGKKLEEAGVIFGPNLNGQKMRIKLMIALSYTSDPKELKSLLCEGRLD